MYCLSGKWSLITHSELLYQPFLNFTFEKLVTNNRITVLNNYCIFIPLNFKVFFFFKS